MTDTERGLSPGALYMSPLVKHDLARLEKDGESRRSAMNSLKQFVEDLDPGSMPRFLAQVSETRDQGVSRSYAISLYEEVARVHGKLIIPYIPRVMATVTRSLSSSGGSPQLHQACAKVVSVVARHSVDEGSPAQADEILRYLCDPLLNVLAGKLEPLAAGAAICLQALVESEKWKYASDEVVKEACLKTSVALGEKITRTVAHMQLARSLVTTNPSFFSNKYGVALLRTGSEVLLQTSASATWQQRVSAARLMHAVLPIVDEATLASELERVIHALGDCKHDRMAHVRLAVSEALKSARAISSHHNGVSSDGLRIEESRYNQVGGAKDGNFSLVSSSRSSQRQSSLTERSQKSVSELEESVRDGRDQSAGLHSHIVDEYVHGSSGVFVGLDSKDTLDFLNERQSRDSSLLRSRADLSRPQNRRALITAEDFLPFSTPRRLVHSLQSNVASPLGSDPPKDKDPESLHEGDVPDLETSSEAGWSVRDNPIASDSSHKTVSDADDRERQENSCKKIVINSRTKSSSAELAAEIADTAHETLSSEIALPSESLSCMGTSMLGEHNCPTEDAEVLNDRKSKEFCLSPAQRRGRLLVMDGERCPAHCICSGEASEGTQFFQGEDNATMAVQDVSTILTSKSRSVLLKRFYQVFRDIFGKLLSVGAGIEAFLTGLLLFTLAVPFVMLMAKILRSHFDRPGLIPT